METPAVYDLQTEKLAFPGRDRFTIGTEGDVSLPVAEPWGNRGGVHNVADLLAGVAAEHAVVEVLADGARVLPQGQTSTIYVAERSVESTGATIANGETIVLGREKSELWDGYRVQVFV
jgi:hypothetical protein